MPAHAQQIDLAFGAFARLPWFDRALSERFRPVWQRQIVVNANSSAKASTCRTGACWMVETKEGRGGIAIGEIASGAMEAIRKRMRESWCFLTGKQFLNREVTFAEVIRLFTR